MLRATACVLVMVLWATSATAAEGAPARYDLRQLWGLAQGRFPGLVAARQAVTSAERTLDEQKWLALPSVDATAFLTWAPNVGCSPFTALGPTDPVTHMATSQQFQCATTTATGNVLADGIGPYLPRKEALLQINARLTQPLFSFGKIWAAVDLGLAGVDMARANQAINKADLAMNVVRAYYGLKTARAAYDTIKDGHDQIETWVQRIDRDIEKGKAGYTEIDLMRLKVASSQVEMAQIDIERTIKNTLESLRYLVQDRQGDVDEEDLALADEENKDLGYYLDLALLHRPDLRLLDATGRGAYAYRKLRIAELLPDLGLVVNFGYGLAQGVIDPTNAFMTHLNYLGASVGFGMKWSMDFGPRSARLQKALSDVRQYEAKRRELLGGAALDVERAYYDLQEAQKRLKAAEVAERRARGWLQGVKQNIDVGTAESRDMIDALRAYFDQHLLVLRTINDVNVQAAYLRRICGLDVIPAK